MNDLKELLQQQEDLLSRIRHIEETCEGIDNAGNAKKITEFNKQYAKLTVEKGSLTSRLASLEQELVSIQEHIRVLSGTGIDRILEAISEQRWYFFKNKPKIILDKTTGILWANPDYFQYQKADNNSYSTSEAVQLVKVLNLDDIGNWEVPDIRDFDTVTADKWFPYYTGPNRQILNRPGIIARKDQSVQYIWTDTDYPTSTSHGVLLPLSREITYAEYASNVAVNNKVYSQTEQLQFTLDLFVKNGLHPKFNDDAITELYAQIFIEKPLLLQQLNELQERIDRIQEVELLSSQFNYQSLLLQYDQRAIDSSVIQYHEAVSSMVDQFLALVQHYEEVKSETIREANQIGMMLSKKNEQHPALTDDENAMLQNRQAFLRRHFEIGMNAVKTHLMSVKRQVEDMEARIETINSGEDSIRALAVLEREERVSFSLLAENISSIIRKMLLRMEAFEANKAYNSNVVQLWEQWSGNYIVFKTKMQYDLKVSCQENSIEPEVYAVWYEEWQQKRCMIEAKLLPLIERGLKGRLIDSIDGKHTVIEQVIVLLQGYKEGTDRFYLEDRKTIYQKFAFQSGGDLQEKLEAESELYKLANQLQINLQSIIFELKSLDDRVFLLRWADELLGWHIDDVLDVVRDRDMSMISQSVLTEFSELRRTHLEAYISDSKAYSQELQRREKQYNSLIFRMRKDLSKR